MSTIKHPTGIPTDREGLAYWLTTNLTIKAGDGCRWLDCDEVADWHLAEIEKAKKQRTEDMEQARDRAWKEWVDQQKTRLPFSQLNSGFVNGYRAALEDASRKFHQPPKPVWCDHMTVMESSTQTFGLMVKDGPGAWWLPSRALFCPICGKRNPNIPKQG